MTKIRELLLAGTMIPALLTAMPGQAATPGAGLWLMAQDASDPNRKPQHGGGGEAPQRGAQPAPAQRPAAPPPQAPRPAPPPAAARAPEPAQRAAPAAAPQPRATPAPAQRVAAPPPAARPAPRIAAPPPAAPAVARPVPQPAAPPVVQRQPARPPGQPLPTTQARPALAAPPAATAAPLQARPVGQPVPPAAAAAPSLPRPVVAAPTRTTPATVAAPGQARPPGQPLPPAAANGGAGPVPHPVVATPNGAAPGQARPPGQPLQPAATTLPGQPPRAVVVAPNGTSSPTVAAPGQGRPPGQPLPPAAANGGGGPAPRPAVATPNGAAPGQARPAGQPLPPAAATAPGAPGQPSRPAAATAQPAPGAPPGQQNAPAANGAPGTAGQPPQQQGNRGGNGAGIVAGAAVGFVGGFLASQGLNRLQDVQGQRQEFDDDGARVIREPGRTIIEDSDNRFFIAHDENERFRDLGYDLRSERRGDEVFDTYDRPDGSRIITVTDDNGRLLRRIRRFPDGREIVIIDNGPPGPPLPLEQEIVVLPPPPLMIPQDRYIVESDQADEGLIYDALAAPPLAPLPQRYTLDQVRYSPDIRARMRSVDVDTITFPTGAWAVTPDQAGRLNAIGTAINRAIQRNPKEVFLIEGYTDAVGAPVDNLSLSDRRAQSVATILTQQFQVPPENLTTQGYGSQYLKVRTQGAETANRRVTVRRITPLLAGNGP